MVLSFMMEEVVDRSRPRRHLIEEPIYCESPHDPEDVIYSGSEDDYYESPVRRKLRYEAVSLRFLRGKRPAILSAALRGPFGKESGWTNPWAGWGGRVVQGSSETRPVEHFVGSRVPGSEHGVQNRGRNRGRNRGKDALEHRHESARLSPKTLRGGDTSIRASQGESSRTNSTGFLDGEPLARVRHWAETLPPSTTSREEFWVPSQEPNASRGPKKRAATSDWLRKRHVKRRKTYTTDPALESPTRALLRNKANRSLGLPSSQPTWATQEDELMAEPTPSASSFARTPRSTASVMAPPRPGVSRKPLSSPPHLTPGESPSADELVAPSTTRRTVVAGTGVRKAVEARRTKSNPFKVRDVSAVGGSASRAAPKSASQPERKPPRDPQSRPSPVARAPEPRPGSPEKGRTAFETQEDDSFFYKAKVKPATRPTVTPDSSEEELSKGSGGTRTETNPIQLSKAAFATETSCHANPTDEEGGHEEQVLQHELEVVPQNDDGSLSTDEPTIAVLTSTSPSPYAEQEPAPSHAAASTKDVNMEEEVFEGFPPSPQIRAVVDFERTPMVSGESVSCQHTETPNDAPSKPRSVSDDSPSNHKDVHSTRSNSQEGDIDGTTLLTPQEGTLPTCSATEELDANGQISQLSEAAADIGETSQANDIRRASEEKLPSPGRDGAHLLAETPHNGTAAVQNIPSERVLSRSDNSSREGISALEDTITVYPPALGSAVFLRRANITGEMAHGSGSSEERQAATPATVDTPRLSTQDQSPWAKTQNMISHDLNRMAITSILSQGTPSEDTSNNWLLEELAAKALARIQSPWVKDFEIPTLPCVSPRKLVISEDDMQLGGSSGGQSQSMSLSQNPWQQDLGTAQAGPFVLLSSPSTIEARVGPQRDSEPSTASTETGSRSPTRAPDRPSTPETRHSSLPTPDFTFSIKSFRRFKSPTPELSTPPRPSARKLFRSALSQPSAKSSKPKRSVHFALPSEADEEDSHSSGDSGEESDDEDYIEAGLPKQQERRSARLRARGGGKGKGNGEAAQQDRAASPPPQNSVSDLPGEVDKFQDHYAAVASRRSARVRTPRAKRPLLPSESQQALADSPPVGAMAERFIEVDAMQKLRPSSSGPRRAEAGDHASSPDWQQQQEQQREQQEGEEGSSAAVEEPIDDVTAVMENLDEFLNTWDVDTELARARNSSGGDREASGGRTAGSFSYPPLFVSPAATELGVWDY